MRKFEHILNTLEAGDRIVVPKSSVRWIQHHAIYLGYENHHHWIIENKENFGVRVVTAEVFFEDVIEITRIEKFKPLWSYTRQNLIDLALSKQGKGYSLMNYNCETFVNEVLEGKSYSTQVKTGVGIGVSVVTLLFLFLIPFSNR